MAASCNCQRPSRGRLYLHISVSGVAQQGSHFFYVIAVLLLHTHALYYVLWLHSRRQKHIACCQLGRCSLLRRAAHRQFSSSFMMQQLANVWSYRVSFV